MYAALWRLFPGGRLAKTLQALLLFAVVVAILFIWVFPAVAPHLPFEDVTIEPTTEHARDRMTRILVVDNYDSFVFTIVGYLQQLGADCEVVRNDAVSAADGADFDGVLVSPGPGTPEEAGVSMAMIEACGERAQPMLGVCLGHQALGVVMGATVGRRPELLHGKTSQVHHDGTGVLDGLPPPSPRPATTR